MWHSFGLLGDSHIKTSLAYDDQAKGTISGLKCEPMQFANQIGEQAVKTDMAAKAESSCVVLPVAHMCQVAKFALSADTSLCPPPFLLSVQTSDPVSVLGGK